MWVKASNGSYINLENGSTLRIQNTETGNAQVIAHGQVFGSGVHVLSAQYDTAEDAQEALNNYMSDQEFTQIEIPVEDAPDEATEFDELGEDE